MKLNPCSKCGDTDILINEEYIVCMTLNCDSKGIYHHGRLQTAVDAWNFDNERPYPATCPLRSAFHDLMKRYAVDGVISDAANMSAYDREWLKRLTDIGVFCLSNGLYRPY